MLESGDFSAAAVEYQRLAKLYPQSFNTFQLGAAEACLLGGDTEAAGAALDQVAVGEREVTLFRRKQIALAALSLVEGRKADALRLSAVPDEHLPVTALALRHRVRAEALADQDIQQSLAQWVMVLRLPLGDRFRDDAAQSLWSGLTRAAPDQLRALGGSSDAELASWAELARLWINLHTRPTELASALSQWVGSHPDHAAIPVITSQLLAHAEAPGETPTHVALLLPLSGQFGPAAKAVRDGFIAASFLYQGTHPRISVFDTNALNVLEQYQRAVAAGADMIVGPLEKNAVKTLLDSGRVERNTLALNYTDSHEAGTAGASPAGYPALYQFGLSPEDEAAQAAQRAFFDGHTRAVILAPDTDWGRRLYQAFNGQWQALGGLVLEAILYNPVQSDFAAAVQESFNIDSSEQRARLLRQRIGYGIHSVPRLREDADMIFMPAPPTIARQLVPQFRYFGADRTPIYATSGIFEGRPNPQLDADLNGVLFPDIEWVVPGRSEISPVQRAITGSWRDEPANLQRLYAFGADAFLLATTVRQWGDKATLQGETGILYLDRGHQIHRRLSWVQIRNGVPAPVDTPLHP